MNRSVDSEMFPRDLFPQIMTHWGGHRLGLTCVELYRQLRADNYITSGHITDADNTATLSRLPNGVFHGESTVFTRPRYTRIIEYDCGQLVSYKSLSSLGMSQQVYAHAILANGWLCDWLPGLKRCYVSEHICTIGRGTEHHSEFEQTVRAEAAKLPLGRVTTMNTTSEFIAKHFPRMCLKQ